MKQYFIMMGVVLGCLIAIVSLFGCSPSEYIADDCRYEVITPEGIYRDDFVGAGSSGYIVLDFYFEWNATEQNWIYITDKQLYLKYDWVEVIDRRGYTEVAPGVYIAN